MYHSKSCLDAIVGTVVDHRMDTRLGANEIVMRSSKGGSKGIAKDALLRPYFRTSEIMKKYPTALTGSIDGKMDENLFARDWGETAKGCMYMVEQSIKIANELFVSTPIVADILKIETHATGFIDFHWFFIVETHADCMPPDWKTLVYSSMAAHGLLSRRGVGLDILCRYHDDRTGQRWNQIRKCLLYLSKANAGDAAKWDAKRTVKLLLQAGIAIENQAELMHKGKINYVKSDKFVRVTI